jgi:hypothetical protein
VAVINIEATETGKEGKRERKGRDGNGVEFV